MQRVELKHLQRGLLLLGVWLMLLVAFAASGCARGPKVERCISDGDGQRLSMDCFDPRVNAPNGYVRPIARADNYPCLSPADEERMLKACVEKIPTQVTYCIINAASRGMDCASSADLTDDGFFLSWESSAGYICTSPRDLERLLKWCLK